MVEKTCLLCVLDYLKSAIEIGSFFISAMTLFIAWKIYQNFDVKKQYVQKQLDIVTELSSILTKTTFRLSFYLKIPDSIQTSKKHTLTIYDDWSFFALMGEFNQNYKEVFIRAKNIHQIFPFVDYHSNPILPSDIANKLKGFNKFLEYSFPTKDDEMPDSYIILSPAVKREITLSRKETDFELPTYVYLYKNTKELKEEIVSLRKEIIDWLKKYGADDINL